MAELAANESENPHAFFAAATIGAAAAFALCGYELVRSTSNTLFVDAYTADNLPMVMAAVPLGVVAIIFGYTRMLTLLGPRRTLLATTLLSGAALLACYLAIRAQSKAATAVLYVLREAYIVILIEQYWSFLNSTLGHAGAKKYYGPICGLGSIGAILGAKLVGELSVPLGSASLLAIAAGLVIPAAAFSDWAYRRCGEPAPLREEAEKSHGGLGLGLFRQHRVLVLLFLIVVATQMVSTGLDLHFNTLLKEQIPQSDARNAYSGNFFANVNIASALCQFVLAPLLLRFVAIGWIHLAIPLIHIFSCGYLFVSPTLGVAGMAFMLFKTLDYSVFRSAKEMLYIPLSFDARYRAKEWIDVFGYRFGKGGTSLAIVLLKTRMVIAPVAYTVLAIGAAASWLVFAVPISGHYLKKKN
jgi:AAA family ATP:ADP antiporter